VSYDVGLGHSQSASLPDRDGIPFDLGRTIDVLEALVPEALALRELSKMSQFVEQVEIQVERPAVAIVMLCQDDGRGVLIHPDVTVPPFDPHTCRLQQSRDRHRRGFDEVDSRTFRYEWKQGEKWVLPAGQLS